MSQEPASHSLAILPRGDGAGVEQELRISLDEYQGSPFIRLALWERTEGEWAIVRGRFSTIRRGELSSVQAALAKAAAMMGEAPQRGRRQQGTKKAPVRHQEGNGSGQWFDGLPRPVTLSADFNELGDE